MNDKKYTLLTPSARTAYEDMKKDYGDALLAKALEIANHNRTGDTEISLRDIIEAQNVIHNLTNEVIKQHRKNRFVTTSLFVGCSYVMLGLVMYLSINSGKSWNEIFNLEHIWFLIIILGMAFMIAPIFVNFEHILLYRYLKGDDSDPAEYNSPQTIVKMWSMIEKKGKELMKLRGISPDDNFSFISVYEFLEHELISREYIDLLRNVFMARNNIVHSKEFEMKNEDLSEILNQSQRIITELDKRIEELKVIG